jgi:hypothetical protein
MEEILKLFGFDRNSFVETLTVTRSVVAGSSSVYAVRPWGKPDDISSFDGDLDIWNPFGMRSEDMFSTMSKDIPSYKDRALQCLVHNTWDKYLKSKGYVYVKPNSTNVYKYMKDTCCAPVITSIDTYEHSKLKKKVQIIYTHLNNVKNSNNIHPSLAFDYSFCAVEWNGSYMMMKEKDLTLQGKGYSMNSTRSTEERYKKYMARGFTLE